MHYGASVSEVTDCTATTSNCIIYSRVTQTGGGCSSFCVSQGGTCHVFRSLPWRHFRDMNIRSANLYCYDCYQQNPKKCIVQV